MPFTENPSIHSSSQRYLSESQLVLKALSFNVHAKPLCLLKQISMLHSHLRFILNNLFPIKFRFRSFIKMKFIIFVRSRCAPMENLFHVEADCYSMLFIPLKLKSKKIYCETKGRKFHMTPERITSITLLFSFCSGVDTFGLSLSLRAWVENCLHLFWIKID